MQSPDYIFDAHEHIAYCFTCVARTLDPEPHAALVLRDAMGFTNREAADAIGLSESVLRHKLSAARRTMNERFEGLCALINKQGACWQCEGLGDMHPAGKRGVATPELSVTEDSDAYRVRLAIVRDADVDRGRAQAFHDLTWLRMSATEQERGAEAPAPESE